MTPTPHNETPIPKWEIQKKKFFADKKAGLYPKRPRTEEAKIKPAHRVIFQNYKDQGFRNLGKAIRKTGVYSEEVAKRVNNITETKSWQLLMKEYMPEDFLAKRHSELLDKRQYRKVEVESDDGKKHYVDVDAGPETAAVTKGLELAYRLRGSFQKEEPKPASTIMYNLFYKPEVREQMRVFEAGLKETLFNEINKRNIQDAQTEEENKDNLGAGTGTVITEDGTEPNTNG